MTRRWILGACAALVATTVACGAVESETTPSPSDGSSSTSGAGGAQGEGGADAVASTGATGPATGSGGSSSSTGAGDPPPAGLDDLGSLVVLGDSIGDGGGQGPFYYDLLPVSLEGHYQKTIVVHNRAESGSKTGALAGQAASLPSTLPGPVAVAITSGGNDMKDNLVPILAGFDEPARVQMGDNIDEALDHLLAPGRFGAGVEVYVFFATIYDASDGVGDYQSGGCVIDMNSPTPTDGFFTSWNGEISARVTDQGQTVADLHGHFYGHGYHNPPSWYAADCTHPNALGHDELHQLFFGLITGA